MLQNASQSLIERRRYRGVHEPVPWVHTVEAGETRRIRVPKDALISITNDAGAGHILMTARGTEDRDFGLSALDLPLDQGVALANVSADLREIAALAQNRDSTLAAAAALRIFDGASEPGDLYVARATCAVDVCFIAPQPPRFIAEGGGGRFTVRIKPASGGHALDTCPEPLGKVVDEWRIASGTAQAYALKKGQFAQIIDVEGQQCTDFMAMRSSALDRGVERFIDSTVSRSMSRSAYPLPGLNDKFFDQDIRPLLAVRQDTVGRHDTFALACTARGYEERGFPGHVNCSDNISEAFAPYGIQRRRAWPAINFFFNSWIDTVAGALQSDEAWSRAGDYIALEALDDLVCVSTACPDDVDPINGWNPTDIHVRIYEKDTPITHSVSWRAMPEDAQQLTRHSPFHPRTSQLTSTYHAARDIWMPAQYDATGAVEEYWACKKAATLQDMSGLRKFDVVGPDAAELLQHCLTRDVQKLAQHRGFYALMCDARGSVLDDGTLFRLEEAAYRWCCGSDISGLHMSDEARKLGLNARVMPLGGKLPNLALQGPKSRDILRQVVFTQPHRPSLDNLKWFGFTIARLYDRDGPVFMLTRTGFTGELGYEIFCDQNDAPQIWDALIEAGTPHGLVPMGGMALDMLRIEAGLMVAGAEFGPDIDAMEAGLGFAVDFKKEDFLGRAALERNAGAVRRKLVGLHLGGQEPPHHGDPVFVGREQIGVVTSGTMSPEMGHALAMARIAIENATPGDEVEIGKLDGHMKRLPATITGLPFLDPKREKARA